jgi:hypothetical protein
MFFLSERLWKKQCFNSLFLKTTIVSRGHLELDAFSVAYLAEVDEISSSDLLQIFPQASF